MLYMHSCGKSAILAIGTKIKANGDKNKCRETCWEQEIVYS